MSLSSFDLIGALADAGQSGLDAIRHEFIRRGGLLNCAGFIAIMEKHSTAVATLLAERGLEAARLLFYTIDGDGDGQVSWDDVWSFAEGSARQRMESRPAERIRDYSFSRSLRRDDNLVMLRYLPSMERLIASSRHCPLDLLDPVTLSPTYSFSPAQLGGTGIMPQCVEYMGGINTLAVFCSDMRLRLWGFIEDTVVALKPYMCEYRISQLASQQRVDRDGVPTISSASTLFASDRSGQISIYDINRQTLNEPRLREAFPVVEKWPCDDGGIADFVFVAGKDQQVVAATYGEHRMALVDVTAKRWHDIGRTNTAVCKMAFCEQFHCVAVATIDNEVSTWVTHQSQSPCTVLSDPSHPHLSRIIGLHHVEGTPQLISTDESGLIKVWDLRVFRCTQSLMTGSVSDANGVLPGSGISSRSATYSSSCFVAETRELVVADSRGLVCHEYDLGGDVTIADANETVGMAFNAAANAFVTTSASTVSFWDAERGFLLSTHDATILASSAPSFHGGATPLQPSAPTHVQVLQATQRRASRAAAMAASERRKSASLQPLSRSTSPPLQSPSKDGAARSVSPASPSEQPAPSAEQIRGSRNVDVTCLCLDGKGRRLFLGTQSGAVVVQAYHGQALLKSLPLHRAGVVSVVYSEHHRAVISIGLDSTLAVYFEGDPSNPLARIRLGSAPLLSLDVSPALGLIAVGSKSGRTYIIDIHNPRAVLQEIGAPKASSTAAAAGEIAVAGLAFLHKFPLLAIGYSSGRVAVWTVRPVLDAVRVTAFSSFAAPSSSAFPAQSAQSLGRQDGDPSAAAGGRTPLARIVQTLSPQSPRITAAAFLPGGESVPSSEDSTALTAMAFEPIEHCLFVGTSTGLIYSWSMCPLLRKLNIAHASYPSTIPYAIEAPTKALRQLLRPVLRAHWRAHADEVVALFNVDSLALLMSSGGDRKVCLWTCDGGRSGDLAQGRLPEDPQRPAATISPAPGAASSAAQASGAAAAVPASFRRRNRSNLLQRVKAKLDAFALLGKLGDDTLPTRCMHAPSTAKDVAPSLEARECSSGHLGSEATLVGDPSFALGLLSTTTGEESLLGAALPGSADLVAVETAQGRFTPESNMSGSSRASALGVGDTLKRLLEGKKPTTCLNPANRRLPISDASSIRALVEDHLSTLLGEPANDDSEPASPATEQAACVVVVAPDTTGISSATVIPEVEECVVDVPTASAVIPSTADADVPPPSEGALPSIATTTTTKTDVMHTPLTTREVFELSAQRIRDITTEQELRTLHERRKQLHSASTSAARVGVARLIALHHPVASAGARRTASGLIRGMPHSARGAHAEGPSLRSPRETTAATGASARTSRRPAPLTESGASSSGSATPRDVRDTPNLPASGGRLHHERAPTQPFGRPIRPRPRANPDGHTRRLLEYEDELRRCLGWNTKDLHEKLQDSGTVARNWSTSRLRDELFHSAALTPLEHSPTTASDTAVTKSEASPPSC